MLKCDDHLKKQNMCISWACVKQSAFSVTSSQQFIDVGEGLWPVNHVGEASSLAHKHTFKNRFLAKEITWHLNAYICQDTLCLVFDVKISFESRVEKADQAQNN